MKKKLVIALLSAAVMLVSTSCFHRQQVAEQKRMSQRVHKVQIEIAFDDEGNVRP